MNGISTLATRVSGIDFQSRQGYAVAKLTLDQAKSEGEAALELLRSAAEAGKRPASDPTGSAGHSVDAYA